ncbi:hypothetical protein NKG05_09725 [Oerskovia sp. M15]
MHRTNHRPRADHAPGPHPPRRHGRRAIRTAVVALTSGSLLLAGLTATATATTTAPGAQTMAAARRTAHRTRPQPCTTRRSCGTRWVESVYDPATGSTSSRT